MILKRGLHDGTQKQCRHPECGSRTNQELATDLEAEGTIVFLERRLPVPIRVILYFRVAAESKQMLKLVQHDEAFPTTKKR